ncbi:MAG: DUF309 domain-containing protein [Isosphaeraceae bacterium]|nr:DUF309 domain-containing protein [Isosphaeraceae bacterium]
MAIDPESRFPPYTYVPGGPWPHPIASPLGHSAGQPRPPAQPIEGDAWERSPEYLRGIELFNTGYYWEAHEAWEALWHALGRRGPTADLLKGLIKLAAAGVKIRERRPRGASTHARRAAEAFAAARSQGGKHQLGLDLDEWIRIALALAENPPTDPESPGARVARVFAFQIEPR